MKIEKINEEGKIVATYNSISDAAKDIKIGRNQTYFGTQLNIAWAIMTNTKAYQHKWEQK